MCTFLFTLGCATRQFVPRTNLRSPHPDHARIYVKRASAYGAVARTVQVEDNGRIVGKVGNGGILVWDRPPGMMRLSLTPSWGTVAKYSSPLNQKVNAGKIYMFKLATGGDHYFHLTPEPAFPVAKPPSSVSKIAPVAKPGVTAATKKEPIKTYSESHKEKLEPNLLSNLSEKDTTPPRIYLSQRAIKIVSSAKNTIRGQAIDESAVALVYVNRREAQIDEKGNFQTDILLKPGLNNVVIEAIDIFNNKATKTFTMTRKPQVAKKPEPKEDILDIKGKYYAVIIGINNYKYLDSLQTAVNDAKEVGRVLKDSYGFETISLINQRATRGNIVSELNKLRRKLSSDDKLLIYYAGHGYFDENTKKAYWLPVDAERSDDTNWILAERITSNLKRIPAKHILVVSDSCYSGTLTRTAQVDLFSKETRLNYINKILNKDARVLIASGGNEPVADSGGGGHSVFAEAFIKALKQVDKKVFLAEELFVGYIKESVAGKADQIPEYSLIKNSGHDGGDFIFIKKSF
jgi:hypothetical protein